MNEGPQLFTPTPTPNFEYDESPSISKIAELMNRTRQGYKLFALETKILFASKWLHREHERYERIARADRPEFHALLKEWIKVDSKEFKSVVSRLRHFFQNAIIRELSDVENPIEKKALLRKADNFIGTTTKVSCQTPRSRSKIKGIAQKSEPLLFRGGRQHQPRALCLLNLHDVAPNVEGAIAPEVADDEVAKVATSSFCRIL